MNYKVNDNAQRSQTKTGKNHFCYIYNKVYGGNHQQMPLPSPPKGRELLLAVFKAFRRFSFLLGKAGIELVAGKMPGVRRWGSWFLVEMSASSSNSEPKVTGVVPCATER